MMKRKLNDKGVVEFEKYLDICKTGVIRNIPIHLIDEEDYSEPLEFKLDLEVKDFPSRYELGVYLAVKLSHVSRQLLIQDYNFWTTLALLWFDSFCPREKSGARKPRAIHNYILSRNFRHRPRHAVLTTWQLVDQYAEESRFLLSKEMPVRGELIEQMMARQDFISRKGVMKAASYLYSDQEKKTFKKGSTGRTTPGCVYRYVTWLNQVDLTYDLFEMTADQIMKILPKEFERFMRT
tara:strand:- start:15 stop:725 length:711 start_codon:yes stop_codon:yes gene_type:complete